MTNILALPELNIPCAIETNQDWSDSIAFSDVNGNPVALDGIDFRLQCRSSEDLSIELLDASTDNGLLVVCSASALVAPATAGSGYEIGDIVYPTGGSFTVPASIAVTALLLSSAAMTATGVNYAVGDTIVLGGGVASVPVVITVATVDGSGHILTWHISTSGSYSVAATTFAQASTSGSGSGATFSTPVWGVAAAKMTSAGTYSALPANPVAQGSTSGSGAGATFSLTWVNDALAIIVPAASIAAPLIVDADVYQLQATGDGYTQNVVTGALTVTKGIVQ